MLVLGHHFETKTPATNRTSECWGTTKPRHRQILYILVLGHHFETKTPATKRTSQCWGTTSKTPAKKRSHFETKTPSHIVHICAGAPLRDQDTGNKFYILVLGHHFGDNSNKTYILVLGHHLLRDQDTGNKSYILVLGHHFETKTPK